MESHERRLIESLLRATSAVDWTLERVLRFADMGLGMSITLLVDGIWIEGELAQGEAWADRLDENVDLGLQALSDRLQREQGSVHDPAAIPPGTVTSGDTEHLRDQLRTGSFRSLIDERRAQEKAVKANIEALGSDAELPDDIADELNFMQEPIGTLTLSNVVVRGTVALHNQQLPLLRIMRSHVAAWYLGRSTTYAE